MEIYSAARRHLLEHFPVLMTVTLCEPRKTELSINVTDFENGTNQLSSPCGCNQKIYIVTRVSFPFFCISKEFYLKLLRIFKTLGKGNMFLLCKTHTNEVFYLFRNQKTVTFVHCELNVESTAQLLWYQKS